MTKNQIHLSKGARAKQCRSSTPTKIKKIASLNQASSQLTPKQFAVLTVIAMKHTSQQVVEQMKSYQHAPNNGLPVYLANTVVHK